MSAFQSFSDIGRSELLAQHGASYSFQPADPDADPETVTGIPGEVEGNFVDDSNQQQIKTQRRFIQVPIATAEGGPSERIRGGIYTIDGDDWVVFSESSFSNITGWAVLELRRPLRADPAGRMTR
jgi:hypothetical protein